MSILIRPAVSGFSIQRLPRNAQIAMRSLYLAPVTDSTAPTSITQLLSIVAGSVSEEARACRQRRNPPDKAFKHKRKERSPVDCSISSSLQQSLYNTHHLMSSIASCSSMHVLTAPTAKFHLLSRVSIHNTTLVQQIKRVRDYLLGERVSKFAFTSLDLPCYEQRAVSDRNRRQTPYHQ